MPPTRVLDGRDEDLIQQFTSVATLKLFHQFSPAQNWSLREHHVYENDVIAQEELDDLLVLMPRPQRSETVVQSTT